MEKGEKPGVPTVFVWEHARRTYDKFRAGILTAKRRVQGLESKIDCIEHACRRGPAEVRWSRQMRHHLRTAYALRSCASACCTVILSLRPSASIACVA